MAVKDTDKGYRETLRTLLSLDGATAIYVGVRGDAGESEDGTPLAQVAAANEFGTDRIPERSFLRSTVDAQQGAYEDLLEQVVTEAVDGGGLPALDRGLDRIGLTAVADVQRTMRDLKDPPNAPSTVARKGSDNPLIDTGRLRQSISHEVKREK